MTLWTFDVLNFAGSSELLRFILLLSRSLSGVQFGLFACGQAKSN